MQINTTEYTLREIEYGKEESFIGNRNLKRSIQE